MKELTFEEVKEVNGGNPYVVGAAIGWAVSKVLDSAAESLSEVDWGSSMGDEDTNLAP
ncbi:hypothetical protein NLG07_06275 [Alteromonas sp. LMIT006]|jgi:hypothetical protein|uniref:hypothetical protein n=1 Tax=Alteromonadaceae TaxID=72275 RepID=UPI001A07B125|nr:hypothetical protein [Alteromonas sp. LMIT006]MBE1286784.1 hypothetical protein [Alteromonadaceae bacterium]UTP71642.1 hypothetical protein NLG07_06275 [Alteromonas sp. LMIT006]